MAAGKTTVGRQVASRLDLAFVDSDEQLRATTGMTAAELTTDRGRDELHALEADLLLQALAAPQRSVIAAAASVVDDVAACDALRSADILVAWLAGTPAALARRAAPGDHRPRHDPDLERYVALQARSRDPIYREVADVELDASDPVDVVVAQVVDAWEHREAGPEPGSPSGSDWSAARQATISSMSPFDPAAGPRDPSVRPLAPDTATWLLEASLTALEAELLALGDELAGWHPAPGEWCAKEVIGHLIEADRRGFAGRIGRILEAPAGATVEEAGWDQEAVAAERADCSRSVETLSAELRAVREPGLLLVRTLDPGVLARTARHSVVGEVSIGELLQEWVFHDRNHLRQMLANTQARVWPAMGNTRRFVRSDA